MRKLGLVAAGCVVLGACALKGDVRRVEQELIDFREETARADWARAVVLDQMLQAIMTSQGRTLDSLAELERRLLTFQGDTRTDLTEVQRQLVQIQELTGQSQQRLSELRSQLQQRATQPTIAIAPGGDTTAAPSAGGDIGAQELYDLSLQQLRRNSPLTARQGFRKLIEDYPMHPLAAEAQYYIGETFEDSEPDSAASAYETVVRDHPDSRHAPTAMFKLGLLAERRGDLDAAKVYFSRVIAAYPQSDEAELAQTKIHSNP